MSRSKTRKSRRTQSSKYQEPQPTPKPPRSRAGRRANSQSSLPADAPKPKRSDTPFEILPVRPDLVPAVWPYVQPILDRAVAQCHDRLVIDDVLQAASSGDYLLWLVTDSDSGNIAAALTTRLIAYPKRTALAVDLVAGSQLSRWLGMALQKIENHARQCGCDLIEGYGRAAWGRVLAPSDWHPAYMTYTKDLR